MKTEIPLLIMMVWLALGQCSAHRAVEGQADPPGAEVTETDVEAFSWAPSGLPSEESTISSQSYTSFSAAFADILKGTLRGKQISMPDHLEHGSQRMGMKEICSHTDYPDMCLSTLSPFLDHHFDLQNVLEASIKACSYQTNYTLSRVMAHMETSPEMAAMLADCKEQYKDALENLQRASDAIPSRDLGTITVMLSAVLAEVSACQSGFEELRSTSPMANWEGMVTITASRIN
ncbi:hypothetical protein CR513_45449, partial [Mucuna pruriens]